MKKSLIRNISIALVCLLGLGGLAIAASNNDICRVKAADFSDEIAITQVDKIAEENQYATLRQQSVSDVEDAINNIDEVSLDKEQEIIAARAVYEALSEEQKAMVDPDVLAKLVAAEQRLVEIKANKAAADVVVDLINQIGVPIYPISKEVIEAAREAYDALTNDEQREFVTNYNLLAYAEEEYEAQKNNGANQVRDLINGIGTVEDTPECEAKILTARYEYNALTEEQKELVDEDVYELLLKAEDDYKEMHDQNEAIKVIGLINDISEVVYTQEYEDKLTAAREAYDELSDEAKELVNNYSTLIDAEVLYIKINVVVELIESIGEVSYTKESKERIEDARTAYEYLSDEEKELVPSAELEILLKAEETYARLAPKGLPGWGIALIIIGGFLVLCLACYFLMFFVFNKWAKEGEKAIRVLPFAFGKKDDKRRYMSFPFRFVYRPESEVFKSKEDALK